MCNMPCQIICLVWPKWVWWRISPRISSVIQSGVSLLDYDSITNQKGRTCSGGLLKMWSECGKTLFLSRPSIWVLHQLLESTCACSLNSKSLCQERAVHKTREGWVIMIQCMSTILEENKMENLADAAFEECMIRSRCIEDHRIEHEWCTHLVI